MPGTRMQDRIYDQGADSAVVDMDVPQKLLILPDASPSSKPDVTRRIRIPWGQHLLDDLLAGRYASLICAVNAEDNSHGIIGQLATLLPTSQWTPKTITDYAARFAENDKVSVLKYDMDAVEVLALLRPAGREHLTLTDLSEGFTIVSEMIRRKTTRLPTASVCFLGGESNQIIDDQSLDHPGQEPSFESVLRSMYEAGYSGDVYPAPWMWESYPTALYARYPFPGSLENIQHGGF